MAGFGTLSPGEEAEVPPNILDKIVAGMLSGAASLPRRAIENSQHSLDSGTYDPATSIETALTTMGIGPLAGAGIKTGETILGAGPVRKVLESSDLAEPYHKLLEPSARELAEKRIMDSLDPSGSFKVPPLKRGYNAGVESPPDPLIQTVADPYRNHFPGVYGNPREIAAEAAARVIPEDPALHRLWGVNRGDLDQIALGRVGNEEPKLSLAANPRGSLAAQNIQTPRNTQRLIDILGEAGQYPGLKHADAWYVLDPMFQHMERMFGREEAIKRFSRWNTTTGMASPGSDVLTEIQRGTGAHWLEQQGRFEDFKKYAGVPEDRRGKVRGFPEDMRYLAGHPYHMTAQAGPMEKYFETGAIQSKKAKVPLYVHASGVPETGFQTTGPVGDAHFSRGVGLSDTRKGPTDVQGSFSMPEYQTLQPWWQHEVAAPVGVESVPAQSRLWTVLGPQTGVASPLGQGKLELISRQIMQAAHRKRISPETARDMVLSGKMGAGALAAGAMSPSVFGRLNAGADEGI